METLEWALTEIWPIAVAAVVTVYLFVMVRMADREPTAPPAKPKSLDGFDVEYCPICSIWVPAKTPWCGIKGCGRPHRTD
jgi:hypothetical protein